MINRFEHGSSLPRVGAVSRVVIALLTIIVVVSGGPVSTASADTRAMKHILTGARVNGYEGTTLPPSVVAPFVSWAANPAPKAARAVQAAGMKVYAYINPNRVYSCPGCSSMYGDVSSSSDMTAKDCSGNPITVAKGKGYLTDVHSPSLISTFKRAVLKIQQSAGITYDALFVDDFDDVLYTDNGKPCGFDKDDWAKASQVLLDSAGIPVIFNGLVQGPSELALVDNPHVLGAMHEGCYGFKNQFGIKGDGLTTGSEWSKIENLEIAVAQKHKLFWCDGLNADPTMQSRLYQLGSFLLTFSTQYTLLQENYKTSSNLPVMPESQLVPMDPIQTVGSDVASLRINGALYGREYKSCYYAGNLVGPCAVVVNSDAISDFAYPYGGKYAHSLTFQNVGGIVDGGVATVNGPAPPARIAAKSAIIVFK